MIKPEDYLKRYHSMIVQLDDSMQYMKLRKYVSGSSGAAWDARTPIINGLIAETKAAGKPASWVSSSFFVADGVIEYEIPALNIIHAYTGKGSPSEISDAVWMAHRFGQIINPKKPKASAVPLQTYADYYLGLDCNGFVGNYFGIDPNTSISEYQVKRRKDVDTIKPNDVLCWYRAWKDAKKWGHIALIDTIYRKDASSLDFKMVDWGVGAQDQHVKDRSKKLERDTDGSLYFEQKEGDETAKVYICPPPGTPKMKW